MQMHVVHNKMPGAAGTPLRFSLGHALGSDKGSTGADKSSRAEQAGSNVLDLITCC